MLAESQFTAGSATKPFTAGLIAPIIELWTSVAVIAVSRSFETILAALQSLSGPQALVIDTELLREILEIWGLIDLFRNLIFAVYRPGNAVALAAGEAISLLLIASMPLTNVLIEGFRSAYHSCVISILFIILGLFVRFAASIYAEV